MKLGIQPWMPVNANEVWNETGASHPTHIPAAVPERYRNDRYAHQPCNPKRATPKREDVIAEGCRPFGEHEDGDACLE